MVDGTVSLILLLSTLVVFVVVGLRAARRGGDVEDYLIARGSQPALTLGLSFLAAGMGAWILFAPPEVGAGVGALGLAGYAVGAAVPIALFAVLGPRLRAVVPDGHSLTEFARLRFGRGFHVYLGAVSVAYMLCFVTAELTAAGGVTAILSGLDPRITVIAVAVATLAYTVLGGLRASLRTDRFQAWLILALLAVGSVAVLQGVDDPAGAWAAAGRPAFDRLGAEVAATLIIAVTVANLLHQGYWQRVWAARDARALRRGAALGAAATVPVVLLVGAAGILAAGSGRDLGTPPVPFFALLTGLPSWVGLLVLVLAAALVASSVDTLETGLASLVTAERPGTSLAGARLVTVLLMVPAVAVAMQGYSVLRLFLIADVLCAGAVGPALLGLWRRATPAGALAGAVAGLAGAVVPGWVTSGSVATGVWMATFPGAVPTLPPFAGALVASLVVGVGVSVAGRTQTDLSALAGRVPSLGR